MEIVIAILAIVCAVVGIIGSVAPALPGPPLAWIGVLLMYLGAVRTATVRPCR